MNAAHWALIEHGKCMRRAMKWRYCGRRDYAAGWLNSAAFYRERFVAALELDRLDRVIKALDRLDRVIKAFKKMEKAA